MRAPVCVARTLLRGAASHGAQARYASYGTLYVVASPLGNLADASPRVCETLRHVPVIACEDTRVTARLLHAITHRSPTRAASDIDRVAEQHDAPLQAGGSRAVLLSAHTHNAGAREREILGHLQAGRDVAIVCDRGTPGISDPAHASLISTVHALAHDHYHQGTHTHTHTHTHTQPHARDHPRVSVIPGPSAVTAALSVSGLHTLGGFTFFGFPPSEDASALARVCVCVCVCARATKGSLAVRLPRTWTERHAPTRWADVVSPSDERSTAVPPDSAVECGHTCVLFAAPHTLLHTLDALHRVLHPHARVCIARELTKVHEEVRLYEGIDAAVAAVKRLECVRGEHVIMIEGMLTPSAAGPTVEEAVQLVHATLQRAPGLRRSEAARIVSDVTGIPRKSVYERLVQEQVEGGARPEPAAAVSPSLKDKRSSRSGMRPP